MSARMQDPSGSNGISSRAPNPQDIRKRRLELLYSYAPDWIIVLVIGGIFFLLNNIHGFWREFSLTDTSIQHTFAKKERVPDSGLYLIAVMAPLVIMPVVNVLTVRGWWDWHNSWLGCVLSLSVAGSLTQAVKVTVGRPRPDFIARCQPTSGSADSSVYGLASASICTQKDISILRDGFRSFWSGHASISFAGLGFLSWYLAGKLHLFDRKGHTGKSFLALVPLTGALLVAVSRTMDYRHHWHDVTVGSIVGLLVSYFAYRQYYPPLHSVYSHLPFGPRIKHHSEGYAPGIPRPSGEHLAPRGEMVYGDEDLERGSVGHDAEQHELAGTVSRGQGSAALDQIWRGPNK